jgi:hypothetical protein
MTATRKHPTSRPVTVSQIPLPADARALSTPSRVDYVGAFLVDSDVERTPEQWIRAVLQDAPLSVRTRLVSGWTALGLKLDAEGHERQRLEPRLCGPRDRTHKWELYEGRLSGNATVRATWAAVVPPPPRPQVC